MTDTIDTDKYLDDCQRIYPEAINEEFVRLSADLAYWSRRYEEALRADLAQDLTVKRAEAKADQTARAKALVEGTKVTEATIKAAVTLDADLTAAQDQLVETNVAKAKAANVLKAISAKKECLISLGASVRQEMENDPVVRARIAIDRDNRKGA